MPATAPVSSPPEHRGTMPARHAAGAGAGAARAAAGRPRNTGAPTDGGGCAKRCRAVAARGATAAVGGADRRTGDTAAVLAPGPGRSIQPVRGSAAASGAAGDIPSSGAEDNRVATYHGPKRLRVSLSCEEDRLPVESLERCDPAGLLNMFNLYQYCQIKMAKGELPY